MSVRIAAISTRTMTCLLIFGMQVSSAYAEKIPSSYQRIAYENKVPTAVLYGVALAESGQKLHSGKVKPWPWTLNVAGVPRRYPTRKAAWKGLTFFLQQGIKSIDVGIMQVNWRYHHSKLGTPWQALEPFNNTRTGARILRAEYKKTGIWQKAIGRYHSPGQKTDQKKRAARYAQRVMKHINRIKTNQV